MSAYFRQCLLRWPLLCRLRFLIWMLIWQMPAGFSPLWDWCWYCRFCCLYCLFFKSWRFLWIWKWWKSYFVFVLAFCFYHMEPMRPITKMNTNWVWCQARLPAGAKRQPTLPIWWEKNPMAASISKCIRQASSFPASRLPNFWCCATAQLISRSPRQSTGRPRSRNSTWLHCHFCWLWNQTATRPWMRSWLANPARWWWMPLKTRE